MLVLVLVLVLVDLVIMMVVVIVCVVSLPFPRSAFLHQPHLQEITNHNWGEVAKVRLQWELLTFCTTHQVPPAVVWKSAWLLLILMSSIKHLYCTLWEFDFQYFMRGNVPLRFYLGLEHKSEGEKGCYRERAMNGRLLSKLPLSKSGCYSIHTPSFACTTLI